MSQWIKTPSGVLINLDSGVSVTPDREATPPSITFALADAEIKVQTYNSVTDVDAAMAGLETALNNPVAFSPPPTGAAASVSSPDITSFEVDAPYVPVVGANGAVLHIYGRNFALEATVEIGGVALVALIYHLDDPENCVIDATLSPGLLAAGTYDVVIENPDTGTDTLPGFVVT